MAALETLGIPWRVVNIAALEQCDMDKALKYFGDAAAPLLIYRGWILHPEEYAALFEALVGRGCRLFTSPAAYRQGLLFPEFFPAIADHSFPAVWIEGDNPGRAREAARLLGPPPYFIKDFAKSAKEIWPEGYVVDAARSMALAIRALREYRGNRFEGGVVIRPLLRLRYLGEHPFGGKVHEEYRLFFFNGSLISQTAYDRLGGDAATLPDYRFLTATNCFAILQCGRGRDGGWARYVLEVGDGGASALPPMVAAADFYAAMLRILIGDGHDARAV